MFLTATTLPFVIDCGPAGECDNPNEYRVLALADGKVFERREAQIRCIDWSPGCTSEAAAPGTEPVYPPEPLNCKCASYSLSAEDFRVEFPAGDIGTAIALPGGKLTITKATRVPTTCGQGDHYVDYAGTFEGVIAGKTYRRGTFYALEVK